MIKITYRSAHYQSLTAKLVTLYLRSLYPSFGYLRYTILTLQMPAFMHEQEWRNRAGNMLRRDIHAPLTGVLLLLLLVSLACLTAAAYAESLPDLTIDTIWLEDASQPEEPVTQLSPGQSFNIVVTVTNLGQATAFGFYLDVYYDDDYGRGGPDDILAGETQTWYVGPLTCQEGTHVVTWIVNPDNVIAELDEGNNQMGYTFTTYSQGSPPTLVLTPTSGVSGTLVTVSGLNYQGSTCLLSSAPPNLFTSQTCEIVAGVLTGSFTADSSAPAGDYSVATETNGGPTDSATDSFTVVPTFAVTFYTDPSFASITADDTVRTDGTTGTYSDGQRVHIVGNPASGYQFLSWETSGVSVDSTSSADTYMTVSANGWLKANFGQSLPMVGSKTVFGNAFSGLKVRVDRTYYATPFTVNAGKHTFTAPSTAMIDGVSYRFVRWEDGSGKVLSTRTSFTYTVQPGQTLHATYEPPKYTLTAYVYDAATRKTIVGASVYVDGVFVGVTNSRGMLSIRNLYRGTHTLKITMSGYADLMVTINLTKSISQKAYLTRVT